MGQWTLAKHQPLKTYKLRNTGLTSMTNMLYLPTRPLSMSFLFCKSRCMDCLIKELGIGNSLGNPTNTRRHLRKRKSWTIIGLFVFLWNFKTKWKIGYAVTLLDSTITQVSLYINRLYCWVSQMLHETSFQFIKIYSLSTQIRASELLWH
jgi:hypothetical protein